MGVRPPCCDKLNVKKGLWTAEEDARLLAYVSTHGTGNWTSVPKKAGLKRCGKSCRLRWTNYLRPNLKHEGFTPQEEELIVTLHATIGSRWSIIANQLPGRTDNDVKNYWNTKLSKKLALNGIDPVTHRPISEIKHSITNLHIAAASAAAAGHPLNSSAAATSGVGYHGSRLFSLNRDLKKILLSHPIPPSFEPATPPVYWNAVGQTVAAAVALPPPPPPPQELEWVQFLAEDAFLCLEEQDAYRAPSFAAVNADFDGLEEAADGSSFVDEILDRDWEIMSEFAGLVGGHYSL